MVKSVRGVVCVLGAVLLAVVTAPGVVRAQATPDAEFKKIGDAYAAAWAKGDAKAIAALHTKDAMRMGGDGQPPVNGSAVIEQGMGLALSGPYKGSTLTITSNSSKRITADTYVNEGTYSITGGTPIPGSSGRGQFMNVFVRQGGKWLIAVSVVMPAPAK